MKYTEEQDKVSYCLGLSIASNFTCALSINASLVAIISLPDSCIISEITFKPPIINSITMAMLIDLAIPFFCSHRKSGKNNKAINIDEIRGIKIKDRILSK